MRRPLVLLLGLAAACTDRPLGEDTDATSTTTGTTTGTTAATTSSTAPTTSSTDAPTTSATGDPGNATSDPEAPCIEERYDDVDPQTWVLTCGLPELCPGESPLVFVTSTGDVADPGVAKVTDLERARCMVAALRDRTFGQLTWSVDLGFVVTASLEIFAPDTAIVRDVGPDNSSEPNVNERLHPLREPEFFADCVDGDDTEIFICLRDSILPECQPGSLECPN